MQIPECIQYMFYNAAEFKANSGNKAPEHTYPSCENRHIDAIIIMHKPAVSLNNVKHMPKYLQNLHQSPKQESKVVTSDEALRRSMAKKKVRNRSETLTA